MHPPEAATLEQILNSYGLASDEPRNDIRFRTLPNSHCYRINLQGTIQPRTVTDFNSVYYDVRPWPRPEDACLVHWAGTHLLLETTPLWRKTTTKNNRGNARSRLFFKEELAALLPTITESSSPSPWPAQVVWNVRMMRIYNTTTAWWHGHVGTDAIQKAVDVGLMAFADVATTTTVQEGGKAIEEL